MHNTCSAVKADMPHYIVLFLEWHNGSWSYSEGVLVASWWTSFARFAPTTSTEGDMLLETSRRDILGDHDATARDLCIGYEKQVMGMGSLLCVRGERWI